MTAHAAPPRLNSIPLQDLEYCREVLGFEPVKHVVPEHPELRYYEGLRGLPPLPPPPPPPPGPPAWFWE